LPLSRAVHVPYPRLAEFGDLLKSRRLDVEIMFSASTLDSLDFSRVEEPLASLGYTPRVSIHAPFVDLAPGAVDPLVRDVTLRRFAQVARVARALGAAVLVFHSGYERWKYHLHPEIWLNASVQTWRTVLADLEGLPTRIAIENIFEDTPHNLVELAQKMNSPRFGLCFDTGHFNLFSSITLEEWLREAGGHIVHLHVHDNDGTADRHQPPGEGTFPFKRLFAWFGDHVPSFTLEAHNADSTLKGLASLDVLLAALPPLHG